MGAETVHVKPPGEEVTVYEVIGDPFDEGAVQLTVVEAFPPDVAETPVGASGLVAGVIAADAGLQSLLPTELIARIRK